MLLKLSRTSFDAPKIFETVWAEPYTELLSDPFERSQFILIDRYIPLELP
jgi:hypothetical protein